MSTRTTSKKKAPKTETSKAETESGFAQFSEEVEFQDSFNNVNFSNEPADMREFGVSCGMESGGISSLAGFDFTARNHLIPLNKIAEADEVLSTHCTLLGLTVKRRTIHIQSFASHYHKLFLRYAFSETPDSTRFYNLFVDLSKAGSRILIEPTRNYIPDNCIYCWGISHLTVTVYSKSIIFSDNDDRVEAFPVRDSLNGTYIVPFYENRGSLRARYYYSVADMRQLCRAYKPGTTFKGKHLNAMLKMAKAQHSV